MSDVYAQAGQYGLAADVVGGERGVVLGVCDERRFEFGLQGEGEGGEEVRGLIRVLGGEEDVGVWVGGNGKWIESQGESFVSECRTGGLAGPQTASHGHFQ